MTIRVLLVDSQAMFRDGLRLVFERQPEMCLAGEAASAEEAVLRTGQAQFDIVLIDLGLPMQSVTAAIPQVLIQQPEARVIALVPDPQEDVIAAAVQAGIHSYVLKKTGAAELVQAVRTVAAGGVVLAPEVASQLLASYRRLAGEDADEFEKSLTAREREVLRLLAAGESNAAIAGRLGLSPQTIKNSLSSIYLKLGVANRTEAVALALRQGLIER